MFTGLIDHCGIIQHIKPLAGGVQWIIEHQFSDLVLGESIAVDGICLTVTGFTSNTFSCDLSPETLNHTTARYMQIGQSVNLERALQLSSRLGGHFVSGHVDQVAWVSAKRITDDYMEMEFSGFSAANQKLLVKKGSVTVNGVSLTINEVNTNSFQVMLVPHTLERTNLKKLQEKDAINIEFDMLARIVVRQLENLIS